LLMFVLQLAVVALLVWILYSVFRPRPVFVVRLERGVPRIAKGTVARAFVQEIGETCGRHGVRDCVVRGVVTGPKIALVFSDGLPAPCRQQLRNLWALSGWSAVPPLDRT
jgi:hypothetical protein